MNLTKKILAIVMVLLMVLPLAVSCKKNDDENASTTVATQGIQGIAREDTPDTVPTDLNFGGEEIKIFYGNFNPQFDAKSLEIEGDMSGDTISQAVYLRNDYTEKRLNVDLVFDELTGITKNAIYSTTIENICIMSADDTIDICYARLTNASDAANKGYFRAWNNVQYLDLEQEWWYTNQMVSMSLDQNNQYLLIGDLLLSNYANMSNLFFNKELYDDTFANSTGTHENLYDYVRNDEWTWEKYFGIVADTYSDDGNGFKSMGDTFGAYHQDTINGTVNYYSNTAGVPFSTRDDNGYPVLAFNTPRVIELTERMYGFAYENQGVFTMTAEEANEAFKGGELLFYGFTLAQASEFKEAVSFDYGILPYPKYDSEAKYTSLLGDASGVFVIPRYITDDKLPAIGAVMEVLCAESYRKITLNYYDVVLKTKESDTENDSEMIELIRNSLNADCVFANFFASAHGNARQFIEKIVTLNDSKDLAGEWAAQGESITSKIQATIDAYEATLD